MFSLSWSCATQKTLKISIKLGQQRLLPDLVAEKAESHPMPNFGALHGPEEYRNFIAVYKGTFHDMAFTIEDQFDSGDKVATRWTSRVTDVAGDAVSDEQTGEQLTIDGTTITHHDSSGKITGEWATWDTGSLLQSDAPVATTARSPTPVATPAAPAAVPPPAQN